MVNGKDRVERYLLLSNGHNGRIAVQLRFTPVRVVCWNTLTAALATGGDLLKAYHVPGLHRRMANTQEVVKRIVGHYEMLAKYFDRFAKKSMNGDMLANCPRGVFPHPQRKSNQKERSYEEAVAENNRLRDAGA